MSSCPVVARRAESEVRRAESEAESYEKSSLDQWGSLSRIRYTSSLSAKYTRDRIGREIHLDTKKRPTVGIFHDLFNFMVRPLNTLILLREDVKSRIAGAGFECDRCAQACGLLICAKKAMSYI